VKFTALPGGSTHALIVGKRLESGTYTGYAILWSGTTGQWNWLVHDAPALRQILYTQTPTLNTWYHVIGVYDGSEVYLYVNGVSVLTSRTGAAAAIDTDNTNHFAIGAEQPEISPTFPLNGSVGEVIVYKRALTEAEAAQIYAAGQVYYDRSMCKGNVVIEGRVQNRLGALVPAHHVRAGWWIQNLETGNGKPLYITGHSVALADKKNALTIGQDWMEEAIGVKTADLLAIPATVAPDAEAVEDDPMTPPPPPPPIPDAPPPPIPDAPVPGPTPHPKHPKHRKYRRYKGRLQVWKNGKWVYVKKRR